MFDNISNALNSVFDKFRSAGALNEKNIKEGLREVRKAFLEADVNFKVAKDFLDKVAEKAIGEAVTKSVNPTQMVIKIVHDELINLLGRHDNERLLLVG